MSHNRVIVLTLCLFLTACQAPRVRTGSQVWHDQRIAEIEQAYDAKEIDKTEYLQLKNETDKIRADYAQNDISTHTHLGYGHHRGTSIGVGVGF